MCLEALVFALILAIVLALGVFALTQVCAENRLCWRQRYKRLSGAASARPDPHPMPNGVSEPENSVDDEEAV